MPGTTRGNAGGLVLLSDYSGLVSESITFGASLAAEISLPFRLGGIARHLSDNVHLYRGGRTLRSADNPNVCGLTSFSILCQGL